MTKICSYARRYLLYEMKNHLETNADPNGNLWCHMEGCKGTYTPYRVNIWGLRKPETNKKEGWQMVEQQVRYILRHLKDAHQIEEHQTLAGSPTGTSSQTLAGSPTGTSSQTFIFNDFSLLMIFLSCSNMRWSTAK